MKKEKYLQIFNYLLEFSKLRNNPVRNIESNNTQYPEKIWFADIPQYDIFDCITFSNYNQDADYWLKIAKPKDEPDLPQFPKLSETLSEWVEENSLIEENGKPKLKESLIKSGKTILLPNYPEVEIEFQSYLKEKWNDDIKIYKNSVIEYEAKLAEYNRQTDTYKSLFSIYNKAEQFVEEYELIVGVGLLQFQESPSCPLICRHILTSKAEITFEFSAKESFIKVSPSIENEIQIETEAIIDLIGQFDPSNIIEGEKRVTEFLKEGNSTSSPFDNQIKEAIQIFADRIRTDAQSKDDLAKPKSIAEKPTLYFAPALLLRKRNTKSFSALYEKIIEDISGADEGIDIPSINDIIGHIEDSENSQNGLESENSGSTIDETIYFPKKYNSEQIEIIEKARKNNKVLVQGPPGTGKSHTIANLICHLLANGKKVLVTAQTERALKVLRTQMPIEFKNLTVNLLSNEKNDSKDNSENSLDASVNAINDELSRVTNLNAFKKEIEDKQLELSLLREQKAYTKNEWIKLKEKETRSQRINQNYKGTLLEIAERIAKDHSTFVWFKDELIEIAQIDLIKELEKFYSQTKKYESIDKNVINFFIPQKEKLFTVQELKEHIRILNELNDKFSNKNENTSIRSNNYPELKRLLQELFKLIQDIENNIVPNKEELISDFRIKLFTWKDKLSRTAKILAEQTDDKLKQFERNYEVKYPLDKSLVQLKSDAEFLLDLLNEGKKFTGLFSVFNNPLASAKVKERKYFIETVRVNGSPCDTIAEYQTVLADIKTKQDFEELETIWGIKAQSSSKSYSDKANFYRQLKTEAENLINSISESQKLKSKIESISSIKIQEPDSSKASELIDDCDYSLLLSKVKIFKEKLSAIERHLSIPNIHPVASSIFKTIEKFDIENYEQLILELDTINAEKERYLEFKNLEENLIKYFPNTIKEICDNTFEGSNVQNIEDAIYFKHAHAEIKRLLEVDYERELYEKLEEFERKEEKLISIIASKKAWLCVLESLNQNFLLRQHLQAWAQAVKKIGKTGTGKSALKFKKEAQHQMEKCKDSIPCWIMPLYKVAETIKPEKEMYDYVIVDESSQLGADAIFLLYISKNIIIVGDDKQTSPEYVGVDADTMEPYIKKHLHNIEFARFFGLGFSFFDQAKIFCRGMTVLREHFRCMPEIIEFCNKYFYEPYGNGLYPLKQYSKNGLKEPLKNEYCQSGYVNGTSQNISNLVEAEAIAKKIAELVDNENYKGKTFGIIGMQGNKQAAIIENLVLKKIGEVEFKKRKIVCGTSASFQGDERDVMFLSLITANNHNRIALTKAEDERRFNVAVSRAKEQIWLFHSVQLEDFSNTNDLRYKLLNHFINYKPQPVLPPETIERTIGSQPEPFESWFEVDVFNDIVANNYLVKPQYEVAKGRYRIDLVVMLSNGVKIAIECDGDKFHGPNQYENDLMRQRFLERCGWQFVRIRGSEYYSNRKKALEPLWKKLSENDIQKVEQPVLKNDAKNAPKIIVEEKPKEIVQPKNQRPIAVSKPKFETQDLFRTQVQTKIIFENTEKIDIKIKTTSHLFSFPEILVFTSNHNVYKVQNHGQTSISDISNEIEFEEGEKPIYFTETKNYSGFLIVGFQNGKVAKIFMSAFSGNRKRLQNAYNDEAKLIFIEQIEHDIDLVALSSINKVVIFNTSQINPVDSRTTKGVQVMKQKNGSYMSKLKKLNQVKLQDPEYYRKNESLNVVGYYLKQGDEISD